jgi:predicted alpha/beta superfamily hydrolase
MDLIDRGLVVIPNSQTWDVESVNGARYRVFVSIPPVAAPHGGFPLFVVTDGNYQFHAVTLHRDLQVAMGDFSRAAIVVGVGYPDDDWFTPRFRDFTAESDVAITDPTTVTGGALAFRRFLLDELRPELHARFAIDPSRETLAGYSLGGHFTALTLIDEPAAFSTYVIMSPAAWWDDAVVLRRVKELRTTPAEVRQVLRVLVTVGGLEQGPGAIPLGDGRMIDNALDLTALLREMGFADVAFQVIPDETHATAVAASVVRGFEFALSTPSKAARHS